MPEHTSIAPQAQTAPTAANKEVLPAQKPVPEDGLVEGVQHVCVQPKLTVGAPDDPYEKEADAVADKVMRMPEQSFVQRKCAHCEEEEKVQRQLDEEENEEIQLKRDAPTAFLQRKCADCEREDQEKLHRKPITESITFIQAKSESTVPVTPAVAQSIESSKGSGSSMDSTTQSFMSSRFGSDFSNVKVHTDNEAVQLNRDLNAKAFTTGNDIYFNQGQYNPASSEGKRLLAHELTHVVQQNNSIQNKPIQLKQQSTENTTAPAVETGMNSRADDGNEDENSQEKFEINGLKFQPQLSGTAPNDSNNEENRAPSAPANGKPENKPSAKGTPTVAPKENINAETPPVDKEAPALKETPALVATSNPGDTLLALQTTPATQLAQTFSEAQTVLSQSQELQRDEAIKQIPEVPESAGSPYGEKESGKQKFIANKKSASAKNLYAGKGEGKPLVVTEVPLAPAPVFAPSSLSTFSENVSGNTIANVAQNELDNIELDTSGIQTKLEDAPKVSLDGEADVNNIADEQSEQAKEVAKSKAEAAKEINNDFGENNVIPKPGKEVFKFTHSIRKVAGKSTAINGSAVNADPSMIEKVNASLAQHINSKVGEQAQKYQQDENVYDQTVSDEKTKADEKIKAETEKSRLLQNKAQSDAQKQVGASRIEWQQKLDETETAFQTNASIAAKDHVSKINVEATKGNKEAQQHYDDANKEAAIKKAEANKEAEDKKKEAKKESKGFFGWLADKASALIDKLKSAVNYIFDKLRSAVKWVFDKAKKLAMAAIELARKAVVGLIKAFGEVLKGFVDIAFAAFPEIRDAINKKIDKAVDTAVSYANKAFDAFKKVVAAVIDTFAAIVDTALAIVQKSLTIALSVIEFAIVAAIKIIEFILDIEKQYKLFKKMIDGFLLIWDHPEILEDKAREFLQPYIQDIPGSTEGEVKKALAVLGLATAKHIAGIMKYLTPNVNHLINNWWPEAKKMIWFLIWPFAEGSPLYEDAPKLWRLIPQMWNDLKRGEFSKVVDGGLEWMQALNMTVGAFAGWFVIGGVVVGAIVGAFFGGVGAIPGAGAGFEVGVAIGEGIMASMIATEAAVIAKAVYDLSVTVDDEVESEPPPQKEKEEPANKPTSVEEEAKPPMPRQYTSGTVKTGRDRIEYAYQRIANSGLTLGIMGALILLGAIGGKIAQALLAAVKRLGSAIAELVPEIAEGLKSAGTALKESKVGQGLSKLSEDFNKGRAGMKEKIGGVKEKLGIGEKQKPGVPKEEAPPTGVKEPAAPETKAPGTKPEPEPVSEPTAKGEPEVKTPEQEKAEQFAKDAQSEKNVVAEGETQDGHKLKADKEGHIVECTECKVYEISHKAILDENPELAEELRDIRKRMAEAPEDPAVMKDLEDFDRKMKEAENFQKAKEELLDNEEKINEAYEDYKAKKKAKGKNARDKEEWLKGKLNEATGKSKGGYENTLKGRVGEHQADVHLANDGYKKLNNKGKLIDFNDPPQGKGLDGVWEKDGELYVTETKYGTGKLTPEQLTDTWIRKQLGYLDDSGLAAKIEAAMEKGTLKKMLVHVDENGIVTKTIISR